MPATLEDEEDTETMPDDETSEDSGQSVDSPPIPAPVAPVVPQDSTGEPVVVPADGQPLLPPPVFPARNALVTGLALDWDGIRKTLPPDKQAILDNATNNPADPAGERKRFINSAWITDATGVRIEGSSQYITAIHNYAAREGWDIDGKTPEEIDSKFYAQVVKKATADRDFDIHLHGIEGDTAEARKARENSAINKGYATGIGEFKEGAAEGLRRFIQTHPDVDRTRMDEVTDTFMQGVKIGEADQWAGRQAANAIYPILFNADENDLTKALPYWRDLTPNQKSIALTQIQARSEEDEKTRASAGFVEGVGHGVVRGTNELVDSLGNFGATIRYNKGFQAGEMVDADLLKQGIPQAIEAELGRVKGSEISAAASSGTAGPMVFQPPSIANPVALTKEQADAANAYISGKRKDITLMRELQGVATGVVNPIKTDSWYANIGSHLGQAAPMLAATMIPGGLVPVTMAFVSDAEQGLLSRGVDPSTAKTLAPIIGGLQGLSMRFQPSFIAKFPGLGELTGRYSTSAILRGIDRFGVHSLEAGLNMGAQSVLVPEITQKIAHEFDSTVPGQSWEDINKEFWASTAQGIIDFSPVVFLGAGMAHAADIKGADALVRQPDKLLALGFDQSHVDLIERAAPGQGVAILQKMWNQRKPILKGDNRGKSMAEAAGMAFDHQGPLPDDAAAAQASSKEGAGGMGPSEPAASEQAEASPEIASRSTLDEGVSREGEASAKPTGTPSDIESDSWTDATRDDEPVLLPEEETAANEEAKRKEAADMGVTINRDDEGFHLNEEGKEPVLVGKDPSGAIVARDNLIEQKHGEGEGESLKKTEEVAKEVVTEATKAQTKKEGESSTTLEESTPEGDNSGNILTEKEPIISAKNPGLPEWVRERMDEEGLDPKTMQLRLADVEQPHIREAVMKDPTLTEDEKANVIGTGGKASPREGTEAYRRVQKVKEWIKNRKGGELHEEKENAAGQAQGNEVLSEGAAGNAPAAHPDPLRAETGAPKEQPLTARDFSKGERVTLPDGRSGEVERIAKGSNEVTVKLPNGKFVRHNAEEVKKAPTAEDWTASTWTAPDEMDEPLPPKASKGKALREAGAEQFKKGIKGKEGAGSIFADPDVAAGAVKWAAGLLLEGYEKARDFVEAFFQDFGKKISESDAEKLMKMARAEHGEAAEAASSGEGFTPPAKGTVIEGNPPLLYDGPHDYGEYGGLHHGYTIVDEKGQRGELSTSLSVKDGTPLEEIQRQARDKIRLFAEHQKDLSIIRNSIAKTGFLGMHALDPKVIAAAVRVVGRLIRDAAISGAKKIKDIYQKFKEITGLSPTKKEFSKLVTGDSRSVPLDDSAEVTPIEGGVMVGPSKFGITAWHGTPHEVDEFSTEKIGTGEGTQAFGWGLYFAENRGVAESYQKDLGERVVSAGLEKYIKENVESDPDSGMSSGVLIGEIKRRGYDGALKEWTWSRDNASTGYIKAQSEAMVDSLERIPENLRPEKGNLYGVELDAEKSRLLDWDKPISEHNPEVIKILEAQPWYEEMKKGLNYGPRRRNIQGSHDFITIKEPTAPGAGLYSALAEMHGSEQDASRVLNEIGIKGVKYLDSGSRSLGGTSNFVIFDGKTAKIIEKNGQPVEPPPPPKPAPRDESNSIQFSSGIPIKPLVDFLKKIKDRKMSDLDRATTARSAKMQMSTYEAGKARKEIEKAVPVEARRDAISVWAEANGDKATLSGWEAGAKGASFKRAAKLAQSLTPEEIKIAQKVQSAFKSLEARGAKYDVLNGHRDNYVPHVWDVAKGAGGFGSKTLAQRFKFNKARTFETFADGDAAGFTPKTLDIAKLLPVYMHEMNRTIADRQFVRDISKGKASDGRPLVAPRGNITTTEPKEEGGNFAYLADPRALKTMKDAAGNPIDTKDYKVNIDQPALSNWRWESKDTEGNPIFMKDDLALHPEAARRVKSITGISRIRQFENEEGRAAPVKALQFLVKAVDKSQGWMKREMFGMLSPFHQVQEGTHAIGHLVWPFWGLPKKVDLKDAGQLDAAKHGLMILSDKTSGSSYMEGVGANSSFITGIARKYGGVAGRTVADVIEGYQHYLFHSYIPRLKLATYEKIVQRNTKRYADKLASGELTASDVKLLSAEQTNAAYGHLNYALMDRSPTVQHLMQLGLLAPDFLEARTRFVSQAILGIANKKGREQLKAVAILAMAQAGMMFTLAQLTGGEWDPAHPFEMTHRGRRYSMRSVPEDILSLIQDPQKFAHGRVSPLVGKGLLQGITGRNYRGEKVTALETAGELLAQYIPITLRGLPGIRNLTATERNHPVSTLEELAGSMGIRISRYSPVTETYKAAKVWMEKQGLPTDTGSYPVSKFQQLRYALEDGRMDDAQKEYDKLKKDSDPAKLAKGFHSSVTHHFTTNKAMDEKFRADLRGKEAALYDRAMEVKKGLLLKFNALKH